MQSTRLLTAVSLVRVQLGEPHEKGLSHEEKVRQPQFCEKKINENAQNYLNASKVNEKKRSNTNGVFTGLMNLLYLVVLISTIIMISRGEDGLPYLLFYMSALGKLYSNLNSLVKLIDTSEKFKTAKEQLDKYFIGCKKIRLIKDFKNVKLKNTLFSYTKDSTKIKIPEFILNKASCNK